MDNTGYSKGKIMCPVNTARALSDTDASNGTELAAKSSQL